MKIKILHDCHINHNGMSMSIFADEKEKTYWHYYLALEIVGPEVILDAK